MNSSGPLHLCSILVDLGSKLRVVFSHVSLLHILLSSVVWLSPGWDSPISCVLSCICSTVVVAPGRVSLSELKFGLLPQLVLLLVLDCSFFEKHPFPDLNRLPLNHLLFSTFSRIFRYGSSVY